MDNESTIINTEEAQVLPHTSHRHNSLSERCHDFLVTSSLLKSDPTPPSPDSESLALGDPGSCVVGSRPRLAIPLSLSIFTLRPLRLSLRWGCIDGEKGLTYEGLLRTYDNGTGNVDRDFNVLGLELNSDDAKNKEVRSGLDEVSSSIADERAMEMQKKERIAIGLVLLNHGMVFNHTWKIADDLEI
ncbi:hypothetical protein NL676_039043 [Syzygium grande]|nr:hypothetical protein NL676_039043 [Syzygium grande]